VRGVQVVTLFPIVGLSSVDVVIVVDRELRVCLTKGDLKGARYESAVLDVDHSNGCVLVQQIIEPGIVELRPAEIQSL
jgi:hypothetical protein